MARRRPRILGTIVAGLLFGAAPAHAETFIATTFNQVLTFDSAAPQNILSQQPITGLGAGEFPPAFEVAHDGTGFLLTHRGSDDALRLYRLDPATGAATPVGGATPGLVPGAPNFGFDIDPVTGQLRVVTSAQHNFRINPADGTVTTDMNLSRSGLSGIGFSNAFSGAMSTSLFGIDDAANELVSIAPPNDGTVTTIGPLGINPPPAISFDVARNGIAYLAMFEAGGTNLYTVNTSTGAASLVGEIGNDLNLNGIGVQPAQGPQPGPSPSPSPTPLAGDPPSTVPRYDLAAVRFHGYFSDGSPIQRLRGDRVMALSVDPDSPHNAWARISGYIIHPDGSPRERASAPTTASVSAVPDLFMKGFAIETLRVPPPGVFSAHGDPRACGAGLGFSCPLGPLLPFNVFRVYADVRKAAALAALGRIHRVSMRFDCERSDGETDCTNNEVEGSFVFVLAGDTLIGDVADSLFGGEARGNSTPRRSRKPQGSRARAAAVAPRDRPRRVEVAILKLGRRQRGFSGAPSALPELSDAARRCSWVDSRSGRLRRMPIAAQRTCDTPIWLRASGTTRWSFRLKKPLRPGKYILYSRVVTRAGASEQTFTARDRNRRAFTVRKRR